MWIQSPPTRPPQQAVAVAVRAVRRFCRGSAIYMRYNVGVQPFVLFR